MHTYIHTYTYIYTHTYMHAYIRMYKVCDYLDMFSSDHVSFMFCSQNMSAV